LESNQAQWQTLLLVAYAINGHHSVELVNFPVYSQLYFQVILSKLQMKTAHAMGCGWLDDAMAGDRASK